MLTVNWKQGHLKIAARGSASHRIVESGLAV